MPLSADGKHADYVISVKEIYDPNNEKMLPNFLTAFTLGAFHWLHDVGVTLDYTLVKNGHITSPIHTKASSTALSGLVALPLEFVMNDSVQQKALLQAHESVLAEWVEGGAFE